MTGRWIIRRELDGFRSRHLWYVYTPQGKRLVPHLFWRDAMRTVERELSC